MYKRNYTYLLLGIILGIIALGIITLTLPVELISLDKIYAKTETETEEIQVNLVNHTLKDIKTYQITEYHLEIINNDYPNPYLIDPPIYAVFTQQKYNLKHEYKINSFWDGKNTWKIRFSPTSPGLWSYKIFARHTDKVLHYGNFSATSSTLIETTKNPLLGGFLTRKNNYWVLSNGMQFFPVGDTQWSFLEEYTTDELKAWINALHKLGLNTIQGSFWLAKYTRAKILPFKNGEPKTDKLNIKYFKKADEIIAYANSKGIIPGIAIGGFPSNSEWYKIFGNRKRHDKWFEYIISRYAAYNVRWLLFGEVNEKPLPWGGSWRDSVDYYGKLVKSLDPYKHPLGSHHTRVDTYSANKEYIDYIEVQALRGPSDEQYKKALEYSKYSKPLWFEEYWYESYHYDNDVDVGIRNTHQNFVAALAFPTLGSLMRAHRGHIDFAPRIASLKFKSLEKHLINSDKGLQIISGFKAFFTNLDFANFKPLNGICNRGLCSKFNNGYAIFLKNGGKVNISLLGDNHIFSVKLLDIHNNTIKSLGTINGGVKQTIDSNLDEDASIVLLRIPMKLGSHSGSKWSANPEQTGQRSQMIPPDSSMLSESSSFKYSDFQGGVQSISFFKNR